MPRKTTLDHMKIREKKGKRRKNFLSTSDVSISPPPAEKNEKEGDPSLRLPRGKEVEKKRAPVLPSPPRKKTPCS